MPTRDNRLDSSKMPSSFPIPSRIRVGFRTGGVSSVAMSEIVFVVEEAPEGGYIARAVGESIFTEAETLAQLHERAREAVRCHFDSAQTPKLIRLHFVRDEVIAA